MKLIFIYLHETTQRAILHLCMAFRFDPRAVLVLAMLLLLSITMQTSKKSYQHYLA